MMMVVGVVVVVAVLMMKTMGGSFVIFKLKGLEWWESHVVAKGRLLLLLVGGRGSATTD